jgi:hypothetical protein
VIAGGDVLHAAQTRRFFAVQISESMWLSVTIKEKRGRGRSMTPGTKEKDEFAKWLEQWTAKIQARASIERRAVPRREASREQATANATDRELIPTQSP